MISVEQIRLLESKVQAAVATLSSLQEENSMLKSKLTDYEKRIDELEYLIEEFKEEQTEIEQGIISALNKLDSLESASRQVQASKPQITIHEEVVTQPQEPETMEQEQSTPIGEPPTTPVTDNPASPESYETHISAPEASHQEDVEDQDDTPDENETKTIELDIF